MDASARGANSVNVRLSKDAVVRVAYAHAFRVRAAVVDGDQLERVMAGVAGDP